MLIQSTDTYSFLLVMVNQSTLCAKVVARKN